MKILAEKTIRINKIRQDTVALIILSKILSNKH